jgi:putative nucleotidyltransferase with HDIG domain
MEHQPNEFYPIYLDSLIINSCLHFNLYSRTQDGKYMLYRNADLEFTARHRETLLENDIRTLYLDISDQRGYGQYIEENIGTLVADPAMPSHRKADLIYSVSKGVLLDVFENPRSSDLVQRTTKITGPTVEYLLKGKDSLQNLIAIMSYDYYTFTHSINVCVLSVALANQIGLNNQEDLNNLANGALLHDIGKSEIPKEILNKAGPLTPDEFALMKQHVVFGEKIVAENHKLNADSVLALAQHHEKANGKGYPRGLCLDETHLHGRIVSIVDCFDAMTTHRIYQPARGAFEALHLMKGKLYESYDQELLGTLIQLLVKVK